MTPTFCPSDATDELVEFIASTWGPDHVLAQSRALLKWQFDGSRLKGARSSDLAVLLLRDDADRIVAMQGLIGSRVVRGERNLDGAWLCNLMAAEGARSAGAGMTMLKAVTGLGLDILMTAGINPALYRVYPAMGFSVRAEMDRWVWLSRSQPEAVVIAPYVGEEDRVPLEAPPTACEPLEERFGADWDRLWARRDQDYFGVDRDAAYLNWRYRDHPIFRYRAMIVRDGEEWTGVAIYRIEEIRPDGGTAVRLVELHGDDPSMVALLRSLAAMTERDGHLLADFVGDRPTAAVFADAGWRRATSGQRPPPNLFQPLALAYRPLNSAYKGLTPILSKADLAQFSASRADSDQDRPNALG